MAQDYVSIPVPSDRVQEVYELLARPKGAPAPTPAAGAVTVGETDPDLVVRAYRESSPKMKAVFNHLAANPDRVVKGNDLAAAIGYHPHQLAGALGAFGRRWLNRYHGGVETAWPFKSWWDSEINTMVYKMSAETADLIKSI
jgi:hypothetical protein